MVEQCILNSIASTKLFPPDKLQRYCVAALIPCLSKTVAIALLYNPPTDSIYRLPFSEVIELIKLLHSFSYYLILFEDLNHHSINWNTLTLPDGSENASLQLSDYLNTKQHIYF